MSAIRARDDVTDALSVPVKGDKTADATSQFTHTFTLSCVDCFY